MLAGLNYCAIATLSFLGLLRQPQLSVYEVAEQAEVDIEGCIRWMLDRQTTWVDEDDEEEQEDGDDGPPVAPSEMSATSAENRPQQVIAGFCGRCGKVADTCYCFWNVGALAVSPHRSLSANA